MNRLILLSLILLFSLPLAASEYERNKAQPVEKVLFGKVLSVRAITEQELIRDKNNGWHVFGGALLGSVVGHQFGSGSGKDVATILGALIGASMAADNTPKERVITNRLIELMIKVENGEQYMVLQDKDEQMHFMVNDEVRMVYLANGFVRVDKQM